MDVGPSGLVQYVDSSIRGTSHYSFNMALPKQATAVQKCRTDEYKGDNLGASSLARMLVSPRLEHYLIKRSCAEQARPSSIRSKKTLGKAQLKYMLHLSSTAVCQLPASNQVVEPQRGSVSKPEVSDLGKLTLHNQVVFFVCLEG